ncbi:transketolase family protein [Candidatus Aerophobetes bacterium]|nr:transketolase family protein [Candidatus Aerophobetes bacterium]
MKKSVAIRDAYGDALVQLGKNNRKVVVLDADVSHATRTNKFAQEFPDRFFNFGVAEQNMMGVAAGLAIEGWIPFVNTFSFLACLRAGDQLRTSIAYPKLNVKIAAHHGGLSNFSDGVTHQSIFDLALVRSIPNMTVIVVADAYETKKAVQAIAEWKGPVFLRLSKAEVPLIFDEDHEFIIGKGNLLKEGTDITIVCTGVMVSRSMEAAERLEKQGINSRVIEIHTLKPIDKDIILNAAKETKAIVTVEEHSIYGGLGGAVAELLSREHPVPLEIVGIQDTFAESARSYDELLDKYALGISDIVEAVNRAVQRKNHFN